MDLLPYDAPPDGLERLPEELRRFPAYPPPSVFWGTLDTLLKDSRFTRFVALLGYEEVGAVESQQRWQTK